MLGCYLNAEGCLTLCYHATGMTDLTLTLRYYVAIIDQLDQTLCYSVTVGAEIV